MSSPPGGVRTLASPRGYITYLGQAEWSARLGARRAVRELLLRPQQVERERLDEEVLAGAAPLDERLRLDALHEELLGEERQADVGHQLRDVLLTAGQRLAGPRHDRLKHLTDRRTDRHQLGGRRTEYRQL